jgi:hypothetical protein
LLKVRAAKVSEVAIKGLFSPAQRRNDNLVKQIDNVWDDVAKGRTDVGSARQQIYDLAGGIDAPAWAVSGAR